VEEPMTEWTGYWIAIVIIHAKSPPKWARVDVDRRFGKERVNYVDPEIEKWIETQYRTPESMVWVEGYFSERRR
jgi:hypothetical protein